MDVGNGDAQFREACQKVASARAAIASVGDAATELVLTRMCADACKVRLEKKEVVAGPGEAKTIAIQDEAQCDQEENTVAMHSRA